jgi:hypothetical protein
VIACSNCLSGYCERCIALNEANACGKCENGMVKVENPPERLAEYGAYTLHRCTCGAADAASMRARNRLTEMTMEALRK